MKELYTSPEVKLIDFMAQENLAANGPISFGDTAVETVDELDIKISF